MNYFELYPGDYLRDTTRLSLIEHGAYLRLLMTYYAEEQPLPGDLAELYNIAGATDSAGRKAVKKVAEKYFPEGPDGLRHNGRADDEIAKASERMEGAGERKSNDADRKRRSRERRSALFSALREVGIVPNFDCTMDELRELVAENVTSDICVTLGVTPRDMSRNVTRDGTATRPQTPHATLELTPPDGGEVPGKPAPPVCPHAEIVAAYHEVLPEWRRVRDWTEDRQSYLRARWREKPERQTVAWWRGFFEYVRTCPFLMGQTASPDREPFSGDLEWLVRPKNFRKVIEGKYQRRAA